MSLTGFLRGPRSLSDLWKIYRRAVIEVLLVGSIALPIAASRSRVIFHFVLYAWAGLGAAFTLAFLAVVIVSLATQRKLS